MRPRALGVHSTPPSLARHLAEAALERVPLNPLPRVLDPACGDGALLLAALQVLAERTGRPQPALRACLHGADLRPEALDQTRATLGGSPGSLRVADALLDELPSVDVVLCNPPWVSWSGRQAAPPPPERRQALERRYPQDPWPSTHGLFTRRAMELAPVVGLILPGQVAHLQGYAPLRRLLAHGLVQRRDWGEGVFNGVVSPTLSLVWDARCQAPPASWEGPAPPGQGETVSLGSWVADVGVHTGNAAKLLVVPPGTPGSVPVLEGRQIHAWRCDPPTKALRLDLPPQEGRYWRLGSEARYADAPFLIRQTAARPVVGPRQGAVYFRNSLLALYPPDRPDLDVRYLVGWLNSAAVGRLWARRVAESRQRSFPQVKIRDLRALPLALPARELHDQVVELVDQLLEHGGDPRLQQRLDALFEG